MNEIFKQFEEFKKEVEIGLVNIKGKKEDIINKVDRLKKTVQDVNIKSDDITFFIRLNKKEFITSKCLYGDTHNIDISEIKTKIDEGYMVGGRINKVNTKAKETLILNALECEINDTKLHYGRVESIESFKEKIIKKIKKVQYISFDCSNHSNLLKVFFDGIEIDYRNDYHNRENVEQILKVIEINNVRIALATHHGGLPNLKIMMLSPECEYYNYIDEKRFFIEEWNRARSIYLLNLFDWDISKEDIISFLTTLGYYKDLGILTTRETIKEVNDKKDIEQKQREMKNRLDEKKTNENELLHNKFQECIKKKGKITINDITITKDNLYLYQNQKIGSKDLREKLISLYPIMDNSIDFNGIFNSLCFHIEHNQKDKIGLWVGSFKVNVEYKDGFRYIEDIRINLSEISEILQKALCFNKKKDYLELIKEVSKYSIKIHNAIANGIIFNIESEFSGDSWDSRNISLKINLERNKNINYILLDNERIGIKNINSIFNLKGENNYISRDVEYVSKILKKSTHATEKEVLQIISEGLKGYKDAIKKSEKLLNETVKKLNIKTAKVNIDDNEKEGYIIKGKLKEYFITEDLKVWTYPELKYICIIDKGNAITIGKDKLVSRMYALSNDNLLIEQIDTIK